MAGRSNRRGPALGPVGLTAAIAAGDRVAIFGRAGSGKSVLLRSLVVPYRRVLFLDPKRRNDFGGWAILEGAGDVERQWPGRVERVICRPKLLENEREWTDRLCRLAYSHGYACLALDELPDEVTASRAAPYLNVALKRGREAPLTTIVATQRPRDVPMAIKSEAAHIFVFDLNLAEDVEYIARLVGRYERPRQEHGFWYWRPEMEAAQLCERLRL